MGDEKKISVFGTDLKPVADVSNNIIDKFAQAVGWVVTPHGSKKDREIAVETYIKDIQADTTLSPIVKASKISNARREIKEYINMQDILQSAYEFGQAIDAINDTPLDDDWTMFFYNNAKNVCREDAKILWGKILAEECSNVGAIPKSLIHILSIVNAHEAKLFEALCSFSPDRIDEDGFAHRADPIITGDADNEVLLKYGLTYEAFQDLQALGLLHYNPIDIRMILEGNLENTKARMIYFDSLIEIGNLQREFPLGNAILTQNGKILASFIERKRIAEFEDYIIGYYENKGYVVKTSKL